MNWGTNTVEYPYELKDFEDDSPKLSSHTVHSSVNCSLIEARNGSYWRWSDGNRTGPFSVNEAEFGFGESGWGQERNVELVSRILRVSNKTVTKSSLPDWASFLDISKGIFARGPHPNQTSGTAYLHTTLEVNWLRIVLITVSIIGGQILAILVVLSYCSGVYTRDDSHLATAELLKAVITKFDDGKLMTGEELAASLDDVLKEPVSYGTRKGRDGGPPEVDLASGLEANFPPFPQKQQL
ncbi:hypothetical protein C7212DRAFT_346049 [Tuber magnatum]|uniref:Uncharacterized protein n=1 Tax=Tuber magnatum TaxID=42249 RepID=A0A317SMY8_9PEZI|nr:hypothetical protein C7212DRAFT_346049 [Tuber magnatum]